MVDNKMNDYCEGCARSGIQSKLRYYQLNFDEAIKLCSNVECSYMLSTYNAEDLTIKRDATKYYRRKRKRRNHDVLPKFTNVRHSSRSSSRSSPAPIMSLHNSRIGETRSVSNPNSVTFDSSGNVWESPDLSASDAPWDTTRRKPHIQLSQRFPGYHTNPKTPGLKSSTSSSSSCSSVNSPRSIISATDREVEMIMSGSFLNSEKEPLSFTNGLSEFLSSTDDALRTGAEGFNSLDSLLDDVISEVNKVDMQMKHNSDVDNSLDTSDVTPVNNSADNDDPFSFSNYGFSESLLNDSNVQEFANFDLQDLVQLERVFSGSGS